MDKAQMRIVQSARRSIEQNCLILDTETTGLGEQDEIIEVAIVDALGTLEFSSLVKPSKPIPPTSSAVHGITDETVAQARIWPEVWPTVRSIVGAYSLPSPVLTYNSDFDKRLTRQTCRIYELDTELAPWLCLMLDWAEFHNLQRWAKLDNACCEIGIQPGGHRALGDAKAAREVLRWLAKQEA